MGKRSDLTRKNFKDHDLWKTIMAKYRFAKKHRDPQLLVWREAEKFLYGKQWEDSNMPNYKSKIVDNSVFEAIETTLPVATSASPKIEVYPKPASHHTPDMIAAAEEYAKGLQAEFDEIWIANRMNRKLRENWRNFKGYGNGVMKCTKIPGKQEIEVSLKDVHQILPDPFAGNIRECENTFLIEVSPEYVGEVKRRFNGAKVKPEGQLDEFRAFQFKDQSKEDGSGNVVPIHDTEGEREDLLPEDSHDGYKDQGGQCLLIECWFADETAVYESMTFDGKEERTGDDPIGYGDSEKYPNGRHVIIAHGEKDLILLDEPNPYQHYPYYGMKNYSEPRSFWGRPEYKQADKIIQAMNMIVSQTVDNVRLTANPKWWKLKGAKVEGDITSEPGTGHETQRADGFGWVPPPPLNLGDIGFLLQYLNSRKDNVFGTQDPGRGKANPGDSGKKVDILREQSEGRQQPAIEDMTEMIHEIAEHWVYIVKNMWDQQKYHRVKNIDGQNEYMPFLGAILNPPQPGQTFQEIGQIMAASDMEFEIKISVGDYLQHNKQAEFDELGAIANLLQTVPPEYLEAVIDAAPNIRDKAGLKDVVQQLTAGMPGAQQVSPEIEEMLNSDDPDVVMQALLENPEANPEVMALIQQAAGGVT